MKTFRKVCSVLMVGALLCAGASQKTAKAEEIDARTVQVNNPLIVDESQEGELAIVKSSIYSTGVIATTSAQTKGEITGDGVRLRKGAGTSYAVLELMYAGELVVVKQRSVNGSWSWVKRCKTGTLGYVKRTYVNIVS